MAPNLGLASDRGGARCRGPAALALGLGASAAMSAGIAEAAPLRIAYEAPSECPADEAFAAAVRAQTKSAAVSTGGDGPPVISVRIDRAGRQLRGQLAIREQGGEPSVREVTAATCDEVVSALALMTALAIDANPQAPSSDPPPSRPADPTPPPSAPKPPPKPARKTRPAPARLPAPPDTSPPPSSFATDRPRWELGAHAGAFGALSPSVAFGAFTFLDRSAWGPTGAALSLRLGLALAESPAVALAEGTATFRWIVARLAACPLALSGGPLTARPCLGLDAGALRGHGKDLATPLEQTRAWLAATAHGRLQLHLGEGVYLEAEGGFTIPFIRDRFLFVKPRREIHYVPPLGGFTTAGIGVVLP